MSVPSVCTVVVQATNEAFETPDFFEVRLVWEGESPISTEVFFLPMSKKKGLGE
ncbi:hypothetical protein [Pseudomonas sp. HLT2-19-2]